MQPPHIDYEVTSFSFAHYSSKTLISVMADLTEDVRLFMRILCGGVYVVVGDFKIISSSPKHKMCTGNITRYVVANYRLVYQ